LGRGVLGFWASRNLLARAPQTELTKLKLAVGTQMMHADLLNRGEQWIIGPVTSNVFNGLDNSSLNNATLRIPLQDS
jgi:hypothetical protein